MTVVGWGPLLSVEAERALRSLNRLRVVRARAKAAFSSKANADELRYDLNDATFVRAFAILESYFSIRGRTLLEQRLPTGVPPDTVARFAKEKVLWSFLGGFERGPTEFWKTALNVRVEDSFPRRTELTPFRELRNVLTHSLGYVEPGGLPLKRSIAARIAKLTKNPATFVGRLPLSDDEVDTAFSLVEDFVVWVDNQPTA